MVPGSDLMIYERSQASNIMTQVFDGTKSLVSGFEPGSPTAGVDMNGN